MPIAAYRPTFVKSLCMTPIRREDPLGAIGAYWSVGHVASPRERALLEALASAASIAIANGELYREALEAARVREEFLSIASHELRTPLTSLLLQLEAVQRRVAGLTPEQIVPRLASAAKSAHRMRELVDRLLDVTRVMSGRLEVRRETADVTSIVRLVVDRFCAARDEQAAPITLDAPGPILATCDPSRLDMVVTNLVTNAVKYGERKPIEVRLADGGDVVRISVTDHGIGIAPEDHARIFERFERAVAVSNYGGFGVGLWLASRIVEAHGGRMSVASALGHGATFTVEIPR